MTGAVMESLELVESLESFILPFYEDMWEKPVLWEKDVAVVFLEYDLNAKQESDDGRFRDGF